MTSSSMPEAGHESVLIDYVTATHPDIEALKGLLRKPFSTAASPPGYRYAIRGYPGGVIAWGAEPVRNAWLCLSGQDLSARRLWTSDWKLLDALVSMGARITRLDVARDTGSPVSPLYLARAYKEGRVVSKFRSLTPHGWLDGPDLTIYAGAPRSDSRLKVYNKSEELGISVPSPVYRHELSFRDDLAHGLAAEISETREEPHTEEGEVMPHLLLLFNREYALRLRVTEKPVDRENKNHQRAGVDAVWNTFLAQRLERVRSTQDLEVEPRVRMEQALDWLIRSASRGLAHLRDIGGPEAIEALIHAGVVGNPSPAWAYAEARPEEARALIRARLGLDLFSMEEGTPCPA